MGSLRTTPRHFVGSNGVSRFGPRGKEGQTGGRSKRKERERERRKQGQETRRVYPSVNMEKGMKDGREK